MKINSATLVRRRTHGPYEHEEIVLNAEIAEGTPDEQLKQLKALGEMAEIALYRQELVKVSVTTETAKGENVTQSTKTVQLSKEGEPNATATMAADSTYPDAKEASTKEDKPKAPRTRSKPADKPNESGVEQNKSETTAPVKEDKNVVKFNNESKEHRVRVATYLNTAHPKWKSLDKEAIKTFTNSINGSPFEDKDANMLESFKTLIKGKLPQAVV